MCAAEQLVPFNIITHPMPTQKDTLLSVMKRARPYFKIGPIFFAASLMIYLLVQRVFGIDVPIYHFKQPSRLSHLELPFKLLLVRTIDTTSLVEIPVPMNQAVDSWYPDYFWTVVVCQVPVPIIQFFHASFFIEIDACAFFRTAKVSPTSAGSSQLSMAVTFSTL